MPQSTGSNHPHHKKRQGQHQKRTPHFLKVYQPFLPLLLVIIVVVAAVKSLPLGNSTAPLPKPTNSTVPAVLAYATSISSDGLLSSTNQRRAVAKVGALTINAKLSAAAQAKANDMATRNYWAHNTPDGSPPWTFITNAGYSYNKAGENLACGFDGSSDVITGWYNSPEHRDNLLHPDYKDVGFGIANADSYNCGNLPAGQQTIVVAMYGTPYTASDNARPADATNVKASQISASGKPQTVATAVQASPVSNSALADSTHSVILSVTDQNGRPVKGIKATIHSTIQTAYTNNQGQVTFSNIESGNHTVTLETNGATSTTPITIGNTVKDYKVAISKPELGSNQTTLGAGAASAATQPRTIHRLDLAVSGYAAWATVSLITLAIIGAAYVLIKHGLAAHKFFVKGERYVYSHVFVDVMVVILVIGVFFLTRSVANVL